MTAEFQEVLAAVLDGLGGGGRGGEGRDALDLRGTSLPEFKGDPEG